MKLTKLFLLFLLLCFQTGFSFQIQIDFTKDKHQITTGEFMYLIDSTETVTIEDIVSNKNSVFQKAEKKVFGIQPHTYWFSFQINSNIAQSKIIDFEYPLTDYLDIFQLVENELVFQHKTGDQLSFNSRLIKSASFAIPIDLKVGTNQFFVKIKSENSIQFTPIIYNEDEFLPNQTKKFILQGLFYGWLIVMFFYNLFLFFTTKDKNFIFMCLLTTSNALLFLSTSGYGLQFVWPNALGWNQISFIVFASLVSLFSVLFSASFLDLKAKHKILYKYHVAIGCIMVLLLIGASFLSYSQLIKPTMLIIFHNSFFFPIVATIVYKKGNKKAKYILIAWSVYLFGTLVAINSGTNITLPTWLKSFNILQIGAALEVLLFSLALGDKINQLTKEVLLKEVEKVQLKNNLVTELNVKLEKQVAERTKDLEEANATKDQFFSIIAHDLRSPMIGLQGVGEKLNYFIKKNNQEKLLAIGNQIDASIDKLNHLLNNLLNWATAQTGRIPYHPKTITLEELVAENINLYESLAKTKEVSLQSEIKQNLVFADVNMLSTILRNLISNAIKFTKPNSTVLIKSILEDEFCTIIISDEGSGISSENLSSFIDNSNFSSNYGTKGEKGFGLGLKLCKEFVAIHKGSLKALPNQKGGADFIVLLPANNQL